MEGCLEVILKMSLTATFVIAAVCLIRLLLMRVPKRYSYVLWLVVLIRLVCPAAPAMYFGAVPDMARIIENWRESEAQSQDGQTLETQMQDGQMLGEQMQDGQTLGEQSQDGQTLEAQMQDGQTLGEQMSEEQASKAQASGEQTPGAEPAEGSLWTSDGAESGAAGFTGMQETVGAPDAADIPVNGQREREQEPYGAEPEYAAAADGTVAADQSAWRASEADQSIWRASETDQSAWRASETDQSAWRISAAAWKIVGLCWLCGALLFLGYGLAGYLRLAIHLYRKKKQFYFIERNGTGKTSDALAGRSTRRIRVLEDAEIGAPFTVGIFRPIICLPKNLLPFQREMVLAHESMHVRRRDPLWKLTAYIARCIHWFNPFVWLAFYCFEEDMETSCDEAVLKRLGYERRKEYAETLLVLAECRRGVGAFYPVTFGGKNTKMRIRNALSMKKARWWVALASTAVVIAAVVLLSVNHKPVQEEALSSDEQTQQADGQSADSGGTSDAGNRTSDTLSGSTDSLLMEQEILQEAMRQEIEAQYDQFVEEIRQQEALQEESEEVMRQFEAQRDQIVEEIQLAEIMTELSIQIEREALPEREGRVEESEGYLGFSEQAVSTIYLDGICALLCDPQTELAGNGMTVVYSFPLDGVDDGSVIVSGTYGSRLHPVTGEATFHSGLDFSAEKGAPVRAAAGGCVYRTGFDEDCGNYVILIHANGELTYYAHCDTVDVRAGELVERGQQIASVGNTGKSTGAHLHFAVSRQGAFVEPQLAEMSWTDSSTDSVGSAVVLPLEVQ